MKIQIKNRRTGKIIIEGEAKSIKEFLEENGGANLKGANLESANLWGANLWGANLESANLRGANLNVKVPPINSHQFISEFLFRTAKKDSEKDFAARIRIETNQCWEYFIKLAQEKEVLEWAKKILFKWEEFQKKFEKFEK